jgi:membrane protease YdiL (CAAX protease family)
MTDEPSPDSRVSECVGQPQPVANGAEPVGSEKSRTPRSGPWGPSAALGFTLVIVMGMAGAQEAAARAFEARWTVFRSLVGSTAEGPSAGHLNAVGVLAGSFAAVGAVLLLALTRRYPLTEYLALRLPTTRQAALAVVGLAVYIVANYSISWASGQPLEPPMVVDIYRTGAHALFFVAAVLGAAIGEEVVFRGFLYQGIAHSKFGPVVAIFITAVAWAALHIAFGIFAVVGVAILGLYLGAVRHHTRSLPLTILLHGLNNAVGMGVISYLAERGS